jgi:hypothetical protein
VVALGLWSTELSWRMNQNRSSGRAEQDSPKQKPENLARPKLPVHKKSLTAWRVRRDFF